LYKLRAISTERTPHTIMGKADINTPNMAANIVQFTQKNKKK